MAIVAYGNSDSEDDALHSLRQEGEDGEQDPAPACEGDGDDASEWSDSGVDAGSVAGDGDACSGEHNNGSGSGDAHGGAQWSSEQPPLHIPKPPANFEEAVRRLKELPPGVGDFLLHDVVPLERGASVCVQVSSACAQAHAHEFGANVFDTVNAATYNDARLRRIGPWHFVLTVIGRSAPDKHFADMDDCMDFLLSNFQLGYYRPGSSGAHSSGAGATEGCASSAQTDSAGTATAAETGGAGTATAAETGGAEAQQGNGTAKPADTPTTGRHANGAPAFIKEGARVEHFIYAMCVLACFWPEATPHHAMLANICHHVCLV